MLIKEGGEDIIIKSKDGSKQKIMKKVDALSMTVWNEAIKGESWAVNFIAERIEGKVAQVIEGGDVPIPIRFILSEVVTKKENKKLKKKND